MLIAVVGMYALGKTVWLDEAKDAWPHLCDYELSCISADNPYEFNFNRAEDCWYLDTSRKELWKRSQGAKLDYLRRMISSENKIFVVESARYFIGLQDEILKACKKYGGGIRFITAYSSVDACREFIKQRCEKRNKTYNAAYWDVSRLVYESKTRYVNMMQNHYIPNGVPVEFVEIDLERANWANATEIVSRWVQDDEWYK